MLFLKQSTAVTVKIGPFLAETDGKTAETALTIAQADVRLSKNGGDIGQKNESSACTHDELGIYGCPLNATDTGTLGRLQLWVHESGALPVWHEYMVFTANVYDTLCSTDKFDVQVAAYDDIDFPATQKTQITTIDTVVDAVKAKTDNLPADPASETNVDANETKIDTVDTVVDAVKAKTDNLPSDPADESLLEAAITSAHSTTNGKIDVVDSNVDTILTYTTALKKIGVNKWAIVDTSFIIYDDDGSTPLYTFTLDDADAPTSRTPA